MLKLIDGTTKIGKLCPICNSTLQGGSEYNKYKCANDECFKLYKYVLWIFPTNQEFWVDKWRYKTMDSEIMIKRKRLKSNRTMIYRQSCKAIQQTHNIKSWKEIKGFIDKWLLIK